MTAFSKEIQPLHGEDCLLHHGHKFVTRKLWRQRKWRLLPFAHLALCLFYNLPCSKCFWRIVFGTIFLHGSVSILHPYTTFKWFLYTLIYHGWWSQGGTGVHASQVLFWAAASHPALHFSRAFEKFLHTVILNNKSACWKPLLINEANSILSCKKLLYHNLRQI